MANKYPYLGYIENDRGQKIVVLFTSPDEGVVVSAEYDDSALRFGANDTISEEGFDILPPDMVVRLQN